MTSRPTKQRANQNAEALSADQRRLNFNPQQNLLESTLRSPVANRQSLAFATCDTATDDDCDDDG